MIDAVQAHFEDLIDDYANKSFRTDTSQPDARVTNDAINLARGILRTMETLTPSSGRDTINAAPQEGQRTSPTPSEGESVHPAVAAPVPEVAQSETPRTDERMREVQALYQTVDWNESDAGVNVQNRALCMVEEHARQLERELADMTESSARNYALFEQAQNRAASPSTAQTFGPDAPVLDDCPCLSSCCKACYGDKGSARSSVADTFTPTHRHGYGGLYQRIDFGQVRMGPDWEPAVFYKSSDGKLYATHPLRWNARFIALPSASSATTHTMKP